MKKFGKVMLVVLCAVVLVVSSVLGTMAYLTSKTETVKNTFTVGNVKISLDEAKVDLYGEPVEGADRVTGNEYKLIPGHTYTKDPTVTVAAGSEPCYVRMIVTISDLADVKAAFGTDATTDYFLPQNFVNDWDNTVWLTTNKVVEKDNTATYEFLYYEVVDAREGAITLDALFDEIVVPEGVENELLAAAADMEIDVVAHAIQADGFNTAADAWAEWAN